MLSKCVIFLLFSFSISLVNAQKIIIEKIGSSSKKVIYLPKELTLTYKTDRGINTFKGEVYEYKFPLLYMKTKEDTLIFDVKKIERISNYSDIILLKYYGIIFFGSASIYLLYQTFYNKSGEIVLNGAIPSMFITYLLLKNTKTRLDTKNKWSFVNPKENN